MLALAGLSVVASCSVFHAPPPRPSTPVALPPAPSFAIPRFNWPLANGTLSSGFGLRHGAMHEGVDIAAPVGTPVMAAASGQVIFAGRMRGYGKIIIIQHENHYVTVYAHDSTNLVREGQMVSRGQVIGRVGRTGHTTGANLHFEVRHNNIASNPLLYLAPIRTTSETRLASGARY
jgi:lipoprotein NlpD